MKLFRELCKTPFHGASLGSLYKGGFTKNPREVHETPFRGASPEAPLEMVCIYKHIHKDAPGCFMKLSKLGNFYLQTPRYTQNSGISK